MSVLEPTLVPLDLRSQAFKRDPLPTFARMREAGPLIRTRLPVVGKVWMATTYEAVNHLLRDHHRFVQSPAAAGNRAMAALFRWLPRGLRPLTTKMLLRDEPDHHRLRSLVDQAFVRQSIEPPEDRAQFTRWAAAFSASTVLGFVRGLMGIGKLMRYVRGEVQRQAARPRDGLLAALIHVEDAGDRLSEDELLAMVFLSWPRVTLRLSTRSRMAY